MARDYTVRQGDCTRSIAFENGFFWETIWNHGANAALKDRRKDPEVLYEGDVVHIPDLRLREEARGTGQSHRFRLKGVPLTFRILLKDRHDEPLADQPYVLAIDGHRFEGTTDASGWLKQRIQPNARSANLVVGKNQQYQFSLTFGEIDPIDEVSGIQGRLNDLGFDCGPVDGQLNEATRAAIRLFQLAQGLHDTGEPDDTTRNKLKEVFGA